MAAPDFTESIPIMAMRERQAREAMEAAPVVQKEETPDVSPRSHKKAKASKKAKTS